MISEQEAKGILESVNSKKEFAKELGYDYYGGTSSKKVNNIFKEYNLTTENFDRGKKNRKYPREEKECPVCEETFKTKIGSPKERTTCSYSCSNKHFNHGNSKEARKKKSKSLKEYFKENEHFLKGKSAKEIYNEYGYDPSLNLHGGKENRFSCKIHSYKECEVCEDLFVRGCAKKKKTGFGLERTTCNRECKIEAQVGERTYQNGSRKPEYYYNKNSDDEVLLESSWEVRIAEKLDELEIIWTRPDPIEWIDKNDESHYYYPDFFLTKYSLYLDPKNPYCMDQDEKKMKKVSEKIDIMFGDIEKIKNKIFELNRN